MKDFITGLSIRFGIRIPKVKLVKMKRGGIYRRSEEAIYLNESLTGFRSRTVARHEWRHHWQYCTYTEQFVIWHPSPDILDPWYCVCCDNRICPIELDALIFEQGGLNQESCVPLVRDISLSELQQYKTNHDLKGLKDRVHQISADYKLETILNNVLPMLVET